MMKEDEDMTMEEGGQRHLFPEDVDLYLEPSISLRVKYLADIPGTVVYVKSPMVTILSPEDDIPVPQSAICDVFVITPEGFVMLLTFVWDDPDCSDVSYNSHLVTSLKSIFHRQIQTDVCVVGTVMGERERKDEDKFQEKVGDLEQQATHAPTRQITDFDIAATFQEFVSKKRMTSTFTDMFSEFVETTGYEAAKDQLKQGNVLILTGGPGEGKTTIGHRLCYDYHQQGYNTVFYSREQDINWDVLKTTKPTLVVCDNVTNDDLRERLKNGNDCVQVVLVSGTVHSKRYAGYLTVNVSDIHKQNMDRTKHDYHKMLQMINLGISESTQNEMNSKLPTYVGFHKAVKLYRKYKQCVDPVTYFTYPLHYFIGEMENMAETSDMEEWVHLLLCGGNCDDDDDVVARSMRQLFQQNHWDVKERQYIGGYLDAEIIEGRERVYFSHPAIYDACLFVMDRKYPGFLWKHCEIVFEREEEQSHIRLPKLTVFISKHNTDMFLTQIVEDLNQGKFRHSLSHGVLRTQKNIDRLFTQQGDRFKDIVKAEEDSGSFLYWVAQSDNQDLMKTVLDKTDPSQADVNRSLIDCIRTNQSKPFHLLRGELMNKIGHNLHYNSDLYSLLMAAVERDNLSFVDVIVRDMDDLLMKNNDGNTALHLVCLTGNIEVVKYVLSRMRGSKDLPGQELRTPVMMAALKGHGQLYEYLADVEKCQLTGVDDNGDTILHLACVGGNQNIVKQLVTGEIINKNQRGQYGKTPLMIAAYCKHKNMFDWLVEQKCHISPLDFSIKDLVSNGGVHHSTSLHVFLNSRVLGIRNKVHSGLRCQRIKMPSSKDLEYGRTKLLVKHLEGKGSNMLFEDESGMSLLHTAANTGHLELADFLLSKGNVDINLRDGRGRTPVMLAAAGGHGQMFDFILGKGTDLSLKDEKSSGILHFACQGSNRSVIDKVMEHGFTDVNNRNDDMKTPLSYAVETEDKQIFNTVLNRGGDMSVVDRDNNTLLHLACKGGNLAIVEHLLSLGMFYIDAVNREHRTPLLMAAYSRHADVCHHLICVGADQHIQDRDGNDVLLVAADQGHFSLAEYILTKCKPCITNKDKSGKTAVIKAAAKGHSDIFSLFIENGQCDLYDRDNTYLLHFASVGGSLDIVHYILSQLEAEVNLRDEEGGTPVMLAANNGHQEVFEVLVGRGSDLSVVDKHGENILHAAASGGDAAIVQFILSRKIVDIDSTCLKGRTPVMKAAENGHKQVFDLLLGKRADLSVMDDNKNTILNVACLSENVEFLKYLLTLNIADINVRGYSGRTPVMQAANKGCRRVFDLLVSKGADLSVVTDNKNTILNVACLRDNVEFVKYLLTLNIADINVRGYSGRTPVMQAANNGCRRVFDLLVSKGADLSVVTDNKNTILNVACLRDNVEFVKYLLTLNIADINVRGQYGWTPVMYAAKNGCRRVFDLLVSKGADLSVVTDNKDTILNVACLRDNVEFVKYLLTLNIADINVRGQYGWTPVMYAAKNGCRRVFDLLVSKGADLSVVTDNKNTILNVACLRDNVEFVKYLLTLNIADINVRGQYGWTPVMYAANNGCRRVFDLLVSKGADLSVVTDNKNTILNVACLRDNVEFVQYLLTLNIADLNVRGYSGRTPVMQAANNGCRRVFDLLVSKGADLSVVTDNKNTILNVACLRDNVEFVKYLLTLNIADINVRGQYGWTPVMYAANNGCRRVFDLLVSKGADLSVVTDNKNTILNVACLRDNVEFVKYLLTLNIADINVRGQYGWTPVMYAAKNGCRRVFDLLVSKGADLSVVTDNKNTILNVACLRDNVEFVKYLLTLNIADINVRGQYGWTPVMYAAKNGCRRVFDLLVSKGADLSVVTDNKNTILNVACLRDNVEFVKYLLTLNIADINVRGQYGWTPVMYAANNGCRRVFDLLVSKGADLSVVTDNKNTILNVACLRDNVEFVKYLLTLNIADLNVRGYSGRTPVMQAANNGCRRVFDLLVSKGADLSVVTDNKNTILNVAYLRDNVEFVKYLLTLNIADINVRLQYGWTPVMYAANNGCRRVFDLLVSKGADLSVVADNKNTILHVACLRDNVEFVMYLLTLNIADINVRGQYGWTPVMYAANNGCRRVFDLLLSKGADLSVVAHNKDTILNVACLRDNVEFVKYLLTLNIADINVRGQYGWTPVMCAASNGCRRMFDLLVNKGADLSVVDDNKNTILHVACQSDNVEFVKYLLTLNIADINVRGEYGCTPVMYAANMGCRRVFDLLVSKGADLSVVADDKDTILHVGCLRDNVEFVKYLLTLNIADINVRGQYGCTPVMCAASNGCRRMFDLLVSKGADLSVVDEDKNTILNVACQLDNVEFVKYLLTLNIADINVRGQYGCTPVMYAANNGCRRVFDLLVSKGADLSVVADNKNTILHVACVSDNVEFVKYLLTLNIADINVRGQYGWTPVMYAANMGCRRVFDLLVSKGADLSVVDKNHYNILHLACVGGNVEVVKYLFSLDTLDINRRTRRGQTPAMIARKWNNQEVFDLLVEKGGGQVK